MLDLSALPIDLAEKLKATGVWSSECPLAIDRLVLLKLRYVDFDGKERSDGELVCLDVAAESIGAVFDALYKQRFPIAKIRSLHHYGGDDKKSMDDNNCSCFNYRKIEGTTVQSIHSYGLAVDINPLQNPYLIFAADGNSADIYPKEGWQFLNRHNRQVGMVEDIVSLMAQHGFSDWGGKWTTPIDYHHFQPPRQVAEQLATLNKRDGQQLWQRMLSSS